MDLLTLRSVLEKTWCAETAYKPDFYRGDRATGQCCVTALVVQDYFGGDIMTGTVEVKIPQFGASWKDKHFWNRINGIDVDLTWRQFPPEANLTNVKKVPSRKTLLTNANLNKRYKKLLKLLDL